MSAASTTSSASVAPATNKSFGGRKWADVDEREDEEVIVSKPDANGIKTVIEYYTNPQGHKVKVTKKIKVASRTARVSRSQRGRREWAKFGDVTDVPAGPEQNITYVSGEVFQLDLRPKKHTIGTNADSASSSDSSSSSSSSAAEDSSLDRLREGSGNMAKCRNCGEAGHFTLKCPQRQRLAPPPSDFSSSASSSSSGKYVPPAAARRGAGISTLSRSGEREEYTLRVTNLSEEVTEADLGDLFRRFGHTTRIYLAKDRITMRSRGFAFISYTNKSDAQAAMDKLHGHGYDNLILHVEWSKPRESTGDSAPRDRDADDETGRRGERGDRERPAPSAERRSAAPRF